MTHIDDIRENRAVDCDQAVGSWGGGVLDIQVSHSVPALARRRHSAWGNSSQRFGYRTLLFWEKEIQGARGSRKKKKILWFLRRTVAMQVSQVFSPLSACCRCQRGPTFRRRCSRFWPPNTSTPVSTSGQWIMHLRATASRDGTNTGNRKWTLLCR